MKILENCVTKQNSVFTFVLTTATFEPVMQAEKPPAYLFIGHTIFPIDKSYRTVRISEFTFDKFKVSSHRNPTRCNSVSTFYFIFI